MWFFSFCSQNSTLLPVNYFTEHAEYNVNRNDKLGVGSNGAIYPVLPAVRPECENGGLKR